MFERDFMIAFNRHLNLKKDASTRTYAETRDWKEYRLEPAYKEVERFTIDGDDKFQTRKWHAMLKDCAFYYDAPNIEDERQMRFTLQRKYDDILEDNWRPPL